MPVLRALVSALVLGLAGGAAQAEEMPVPSAAEGFWGLGNTGIDCLTLPCPWRGVFAIAPDGGRSFPLSHEDQPEPPLLRASEADRAAIEAAYRADRCVIAEGHFEAGILVVRRLHGAC